MLMSQVPWPYGQLRVSWSQPQVQYHLYVTGITSEYLIIMSGNGLISDAYQRNEVHISNT